MAGGFEKFDQIVALDRGGHSVDQRVVIESVVRHHGGVENNRDPAIVVIDGTERRHRARLHAPDLAQQIGRAEGKPAIGAEQAVQPFEVDGGVFLRHHQVKLIFLVAQEQVLGVAAGNLAA